MRFEMFSLVSVISVLAAGCGNIKDSKNTKYSSLPELETLDVVAAAASNENEFLQTDEAPPACVYWNALAQVPHTTPSFRLYRALYRDSQNGKLLAVQAVAENPHILFDLSAEKNPQGKPLDPPSIPEFVEMARAEYQAGNTSWGKLKLLELLASAGVDSQVISARNKIVTERLEAKIPGGVTGAPTALEGSAIFEMARAAIPELHNLSASQTASLGHLTRKAPLFLTDSALGRFSEIGRTLQVLSSSSEGLSLDEKLCRFALSQRLTAQLLTLKGVVGAPVTSEEGLLLPTADEELWTYPETSLGGNFGGALDEKELKAKVASKAGVRGSAAVSTAELIASIRTSLRLMGSHVSSEVWSEKTGLTEKLLPLAFAFFGLEMPLIKNEITVLPGNRLRLADDSLANLLELGELALDGIWVAERLRTPNTLITKSLGAPEIEALSGAQAESVDSSLKQLLAGLLLEIRARSEVESGGLAKLDPKELNPLARFYTRAGQMLGNAMLLDRAVKIQGLVR